jgi:N-sulfoglucosamine sulfohydrolase
MGRALGSARPGAVQPAMVTWADLTPTLLDVAGAPAAPGECDGRSFRAGLDGAPLRGWDEIHASHSLHEITMYYPMRAVRTRTHKLILNLAHELTWPSALDLIKSPTWISATTEAGDGKLGRRPIAQFLRRPKLELYDLARDPDEVENLAGDPAHAALRDELLAKIKAFQLATKDPWARKWNHE